MGRRFRRRPPLGFWLILLFASLFTARRLQTTGEPPLTLAEGKATVLSVVDGRTIVVGNAASSDQPTVAVRLIGLRASENVRARDWLSQHVGQAVQIELDKRRRDIDGTSLAYVYYEERLLNAELLRLGLAEYEPYPGDSPTMAKMLRGAADIQQAARRFKPVPSVGR